MEFGPRVRELREAQRISLRTVAKALELSAPYVSDMELGRRNPPGVEAVLIHWAQIIGADPEELIGLAKAKRRPCADCPLKEVAAQATYKDIITPALKAWGLCDDPASKVKDDAQKL